MKHILQNAKLNALYTLTTQRIITLIFLCVTSLEAYAACADPYTLQRGLNWSGCDKAGGNFTNLIFNQANLESAVFASAQLTQVTLSETNAKSANFSRANMSSATIFQSDLFNANFSHANLERAQIAVSNLTFANLSYANLNSAIIKEQNLRFTDFRFASLRNANLISANLRLADLSETDLTGANLQKANLTDSELMKANLTDTRLNQTNMTGANLTGARGILSALPPAASNLVCHDGFTRPQCFKSNGEPINYAPNITGTPSHTVVAGNQYTFTAKVLDISTAHNYHSSHSLPKSPSSDLLKFNVVNQPNWLQLTTSSSTSTLSATVTLSGTPVYSYAKDERGTYSNIIVQVGDGFVTRDLRFNIYVTANAPIIKGTPSTTVQSGEAYYFRPTAQDPNGDTLSFSIVNKPSWANFDGATGSLFGTVSNDFIKKSGITIKAHDSNGNSRELPPFIIQKAQTVVKQNKGGNSASWTVWGLLILLTLNCLRSSHFRYLNKQHWFNLASMRRA